jgi:hypothetical protein
VEDKPQEHKVYVSKPLRRQWHGVVPKLVAIIIILVVALLGYLLVSKLISPNSTDSTTEKVLTVNDLDVPDVKLDSNTSDASVENLTKVLKAKIDKQIAAKENPFETVKQLAGVLANTTNITRPEQMTAFLEDFLAKHEDSLRFATEYETPDQAQINFWKAELYAKLAYGYRSTMQNKFTGSDGKPIDTTKEQLKYIDLYLALANDPASHPPIPEQSKDIIVGYNYNEASDLLGLKNSLTSGGVVR